MIKIETAIKADGEGYAVKVTADQMTVINYIAPSLAAAIYAVTSALLDLAPAVAKAVDVKPTTADTAAVTGLAYETTYDRRSGTFTTTLIQNRGR